MPRKGIIRTVPAECPKTRSGSEGETMSRTVHIKLTVRENGEGFFGPGIAELMEQIRETGSVKEACLAMGISYTKGRRILKRAERCLGYPILQIRHGGAGGGAASLTPEGEKALADYRALEEDVSGYAGRKFSEFRRRNGNRR